MKYLGIDPAFRKTGFAICILDEEKTARFKIVKGGLLEFLRLIDEMPNDVFSCVENSNLQNATFDMRGSKSAVAKKSRNVGANQAASEYTYQATVKRWGNRAFQVSPKGKGRKITESEFKALIRSEKLTLIDYQSNQDFRDAYKLAQIAKTKSKVLRWA